MNSLNLKRMMYNSRALNDLDPSMRNSLNTLLSNLKSKHGLEFVAYSTLRGPGVQANLFAQSRTPKELRDGTRIRSGREVPGYLQLEDEGAPWLASLLRQARPLVGRHVTDALPGRSWHQFGMAADLYLSVNGRAVWNDRKAFATLVNEARLSGLHTVSWEANHVQLMPAAAPSYSWAELDKILKPAS